MSVLERHRFKIMPAPQSERRSDRSPVKARARFREPGLNPFEVELFDLSSTGFRMVTAFRPPIGKHVWVSLPGLQPLEAVVRRSDGNTYGCEFLYPLHPAIADHLKNKLRPAD